MKSPARPNRFFRIVESEMRRWFKAACRFQYSRARKIAVETRDLLERERRHARREWDRIYRYGGSILFSGLRDFIDVQISSEIDNWIRKPEIVESTWDLLHDAEARISGCHLCLSDEVRNFLLTRLHDKRVMINMTYGPGSYVSPGHTLSALICSLCKEDIRACDHVPGNLYDGYPCTVSPVIGGIDHVAIVENPEDPRCRIWPWHVEQGDEEGRRKVRVTILRAFSLCEDKQNSGN